MTQGALKPKLAKLGLRQSDLARLIDVSPRTVNLWASGAQSLPGAVDGYLRLLEAAAPNVRKAEFDRLDDRSKHLDEGVYGIAYQAAQGDEQGYGLAVLLRGKISGCDGQGSFFSGGYRFDRVKGVNVVQLSFEAIPGAAAAAQMQGLNATFTTARAQPVAPASAVIGDEVYELVLRYLGPLPE